jgi:hypothetical protein
VEAPGALKLWPMLMGRNPGHFRDIVGRRLQGNWPPGVPDPSHGTLMLLSIAGWDADGRVRETRGVEKRRAQS